MQADHYLKSLDQWCVGDGVLDDRVELVRRGSVDVERARRELKLTATIQTAILLSQAGFPSVLMRSRVTSDET